jgi:hypothetical protein
MRWKHIHTAAKDMEKLEIGLLASTDFEWRGSLITVNGHIVQSEMVVEGIGPELRRKVATSEHGMKSITNRLMRALAWPVLMG